MYYGKGDFMSTRELAYSMIDNLTEEQLNALIVVLRGWEVENDVPNGETLAAMQECEDIINGKIEAKSYSSAHEMIEDILSEKNDDE